MEHRKWACLRKFAATPRNRGKANESRCVLATSLPGISKILGQVGNALPTLCNLLPRTTTGAQGLRRRRAREAREAVHVRAERMRDRDAAVGLLVILEDGDERAADRQTRAVQGVAV